MRNERTRGPWAEKEGGDEEGAVAEEGEEEGPAAGAGAGRTDTPDHLGAGWMGDILGQIFRAQDV